MDSPFNAVHVCKPFENPENYLYAITILLKLEKSERFAVASTDGHVAVFDTLNVENPQINFRPHEYAVTDICCLGQNKILSCSRDGSIKLSDFRQKDYVVNKIQLLNGYDGLADLYSVDTGGSTKNLICASAEQALNFYDLRKLTKAPIHKLEDIHSDIVNVVRFHPTALSILVSGSDDNTVVFQDTNNLACFNEAAKKGFKKHCKDKPFNNYSFKEDTNSDEVDEDEKVFIGAFPNDSAPRIIRFIHNDKIATISTTEIVQTWSCPNLIESISEDFCARSVLAPTTSVRDAMQYQDSLGYVVDVITTKDKEYYLGGSICGDLCLFRVSKNAAKIVKKFDNQTGHTGIIRSSIAMGNSLNKLSIITGGEDGHLYIWNVDQEAK